MVSTIFCHMVPYRMAPYGTGMALRHNAMAYGAAGRGFSTIITL